MSTFTAPPIRTIRPKELAALLRDPIERARTLVVDVRDDDHVGGHIRDSLHIPSRTFYERVHGLVVEHDLPPSSAKPAAAANKGDELAASAQPTDQRIQQQAVKQQKKKRIVFHCSLSQQRGPKAARVYTEARDLLRPRSSAATGSGTASASTPSTTTTPATMTTTETTKMPAGAEVLVLEGGFVNWQSQGFAEDAALTDRYEPEIWRYGFQG